MKKVEERTNLDLLELTLQLHSRAINLPNNREMHEASVEARQELEKRLQVNKNAVLPHVSNLLIAWEQYKRDKWWDSDGVDVEKVLMEQFIVIYSR